MDDTVMQALKRHLASADTIDVSRFQFLNLEAVRNAAGSLWPEVRARVFLAASSMIERRVADADMIVPCATGFLVIYKAISGAAAEETTQRIREDMERFFLGERFAELLRVTATSETLTPAQFQAALAEAGVEQPPPAEPAPAPPAKPEALIAGLEFWSAWDVRKEAVASFFVSPDVRETKDGAALSELGLEAVLSKPDDRLAFDLAVLKRSADALEAQLSRGVRCALIAPAGYSMVASSRHRAGYVSALAALPAKVRDLLWVRVTGAPSDAPAAIVAETGHTLKSYAAQLFFDAELSAATLQRALESDAPWLGARAPARLTDAARQDVERFAAQAARGKRSVYLYGVDDWEMLRYASRGAAQLLIGRALGRHDTPPAPYKLGRNSLLARAA